MNYIVKNVKYITLVAFLFFSPFVVNNLAAQETSRMICHAGGTMSVIVAPSSNPEETWLQIRFVRSRFSFNNIRPKEGECTFLNRKISDTEPDIMAISLRVKVWTEFRAIGEGIAKAGVIPKTRYKSDQDTAKEILKQARNSGYFTAEVYNTKEGYFKIVSVSDGVE